MEIFSTNSGRVAAIEGEFTPMLIEIGDDMEDDDPNANWGGYYGFRAIVTGFSLKQQGGFQFVHTLRDFLYLYVFGERIAQMTIEGLAFNANCESRFDDLVDVGPNTIRAQYHGLEWLQDYYLANRVTERPDPITIVLGLDTPFVCFLTGMHIEMINIQEMPYIARFSMGFFVLPEGGEDEFDDDDVLDAELQYSAQLQEEAGTGTGSGGDFGGGDDDWDEGYQPAVAGLPDDKPPKLVQNKPDGSGKMGPPEPVGPPEPPQGPPEPPQGPPAPPPQVPPEIGGLTGAPPGLGIGFVTSAPPGSGVDFVTSDPGLVDPKGLAAQGGLNVVDAKGLAGQGGDEFVNEFWPG